MTTTTAERRSLSEAVRQPGPWTWAYVDVSGNREDPRHLADLQVRTVRDQLMAQGAPAADVALVEDVLGEQPGVPAPVNRYVLVRNGEIVVSDVLPGHLHGQESVGHGVVADLVPLIAHRPLDVPFLVVEVGREGGGYRAYHLGHAETAADDAHVQGRTDTLHKIKGGGWNHLRWQHHVEEIWKQTEGEVADAVESAVERLRPRLVVLAGDVRARQLFVDRLSTATRALVSEVPIDPRASDASEDALVEHVDIALARVVAQRRHDVEDLLRTHDARGDRTAASGLGPVVEALAQAQVSVLALDPAAFADRTVLALDAPPWIATAPEQALGAGELGRVPAQVGLVRAALATDAEVVFANAASLPDGNASVREGAHPEPVAALLRWPTGPAVPGASGDVPGSGAGPGAGFAGAGEGADAG